MAKKIPNLVRRAAVVAHFVSKQVLEGFPNPLNQPEILDRGSKDCEALVRFSFENGLDVRVYLYNIGLLIANDVQDWVVTRVSVRNRKDKIPRIVAFGADKLKILQDQNPWDFTTVCDRDSICSVIGVFWDAVSSHGFTRADVVQKDIGNHKFVAREYYYPLVAGSKERAQVLADKKLNTLWHQD